MDLGRGVLLRKALVGLWIVGAAAALATPVAAQSQEQPQAQPQTSVDAFMTEIGDGMRAIHTRANGDAAQVVAGCRDFLGRVLNLETMARAVTEADWERMSVAQREAYQAAFADRLASECARALADYKGEPIRLAGIRSTPDGDKLATLRVGAEDAKMIAWRLHDAGSDTWAAVDVIWDGHGAIAKARAEFAAGLQAANGDVDALIGHMRR
jgi:ABC-type transporter MlaC component